MKYKQTIISYRKLAFILAFGLSVGCIHMSSAESLNHLEHSLPLDSINTQIINGNRFVIHKLKSKESYYQLSRLYSVPVKDIKDANNNKNLIIGDNVKIPRGKFNAPPEPIKAQTTKATTVKTESAKTEVTKIESTAKNTNNKVLSNPNNLTEYKVGKSETLWAISKRFQLSVDDIKKYNNLSSNNIKEGDVIKIPNTSLPVEKPVEKTIEKPVVSTPIVTNNVAVIPDIIEENQPVDDSIFKPNKYGIQEKKERGIGMWQESLSGDGQTSLALHKTAPVGTILKITNPMNQNVTFAKVVGIFGDNEETQGAIVVLSKAVASSIGLLDKKFQIEITYGAPLD